MTTLKKSLRMPNSNQRVLGIDPGYERLGVAIIDKSSGQEVVLESACFKTSAKLPFPERLRTLGENLEQLIVKWQPAVLALEKLFFTSNQKTAIQVAEVRGMIIYLAASHGLKLVEYTPLEIKMCLTGYGRADKKQLTDMVGRLVKLPPRFRHDDEFDAVAVGLTYLARQSLG
jgi:crossover junction endodeoxyribonuclease RuvC